MTNEYVKSTIGTNKHNNTYCVMLYLIDSDQRPDLNRCPLLKLASTDVIISITVRFKGIPKSVSFPNSQIYGQLIG